MRHGPWPDREYRAAFVRVVMLNPVSFQRIPYSKKLVLVAALSKNSLLCAR